MLRRSRGLGGEAVRGLALHAGVQQQPVFQRRKFFQGRSIRGEGVKDVSWFGPDGKIYGIELLNANEQLESLIAGKLTLENGMTGKSVEVALP